MEILSLNFVIFVIQLAFCIVPIVLGIRLLCISKEVKNEIRQKLSKKLLGDPTLMVPSFFNFVLYFIAGALMLFSLIFTLFIIFVVMPK